MRLRGGSLGAALVLIAAAIFIFLPVVLLVQFSFQDGLVPVPPFKGFSLRWYAKALENRRLTEALWNSALVAVLSSLVATSPPMVWRAAARAGTGSRS
jgi:spermidine/putrescine transport system permease protein